MLENQSKKILLLSDDPADVSFVVSVAVTQQADLELAVNMLDLCAKIAKYRADESLAAIFLDVSTPALLRKFEYELQSKMGSSLAGELSSMIHFLSGTPLALNREIKQSPYFSFYSERKTSDFSNSANFYENSFYLASEFLLTQQLSFDQASRSSCFEKIKKEFLLKDVSSEWMMRLKKTFEDMLEQVFPARFNFNIDFLDNTFRVVLNSANIIVREDFRVEDFLEFGVSAIVSSKNIVLLAPVFQDVLAAAGAFKFYKVEHE